LALFISVALCAGEGEDAHGEKPRPVFRAEGQITRLTHSGDHSVACPSISDDGQIIVYQEEIRDTATDTGETLVTRFIKRIMADGSGEEVLFRDSTAHAPHPYEQAFLVVGTKPPLVSGDGQTVVFSLSTTAPEEMADHFLGIMKTDGSGLLVVEYLNEALSSIDWKRHKCSSQMWERIVTYDISDDGQTIACVVRGHFGPVAYGVPGGIIIMNGEGVGQRTFLAPRLIHGQWTWEGFPRKPLVGGGWSFALSGDGTVLLCGGQSSDAASDYDLYLMDCERNEFRRLTHFSDRLFNLGDISDDGKRVSFFYSGTKGEGAGTYRIDADGTNLSRCSSRQVARLDGDDMSGDGSWLVFQGVMSGWALDLNLDQEILLFDSGTPGFVRSGLEMDFPSYPSFWGPRFLSRDGRTILLSGVPVGKDEAELHVLQVRDMKKVSLVCPHCRQRMEPSWQYCPYDGTGLK